MHKGVISMADHFDYTIGLNLAALLVCVTNFIFTLLEGRFKKPQNKIYFTIIFLLCINSVCGIVSDLADKMGDGSESDIMVLRVSRYVYFVTHTMLAPMFFFYISHVVGRLLYTRRDRSNSDRPKWHLIGLLPHTLLGIAMILIMTNPVHHWIWDINNDGTFVRNWGEYTFVYLQSAVWMVASFVLVMRSWNILSVSRKHGMIFSYLLMLTGVLIQLVFREIRVEVLMESLAFTGVLLFIENEDDRRNVELGVYNSASFTLDITAAMKNNKHLKLLILRDIALDKTANPMLPEKIDLLSVNKKVAAQLCETVTPNNIYAPVPNVFIISFYDSEDEKVKRTAEAILERFNFPWDIDGISVFLKASIMVVDVPERAKTMQEILYIASCSVPEDNEKILMEGSDLDWIVRYSAVEKAVQRGLENAAFEVCYQPTYRIDGTLFGAEALVRMNDMELGRVFPDEFIPIAERVGMIDDVDEFVLKEVCRLMHTGQPQKYGVGHINVNLSVQECMKKGFAEHIIKTVDDAGVARKHISFEITESVAATDHDRLAEIIGKLKDAGFTFYIDDFGTGYSNMSSLFSLGADVIKIDKSVLWSAEKSELGMVLLRSTIRMISNMHKRTLAEGVETEKQMETLAELGCDYLQGFYFSKPLQKDDFLEFIKQGIK